MSALGDSRTRNELGTNRENGLEQTDPGADINRPLTSLPNGRSPASAAQPNLPDSWWKVSVLMLLVSLGLHSSLLLMPIPSQQKPTPPKPEKQIRVTQLLTIPKSRPKSRSVTAPKRPTIKSTLPIPKPTARSLIIPSVSQPKPKETPSAPQTTATPAQLKQPAPSSLPLSSATNWDDFPRYPTAQPGCFGLQSCFQTAKDLDLVAAYFEKELLAKQYAAKLSLPEASRKVYQVTRNGTTQFLSLIFAGGAQGTVYVLADEPRNLEDFKHAVEVPPEISNILAGLDSQKAERSNFTQPDSFYTPPGSKDAAGSAPRSEIVSINLVSDQTPDTLLDSFFRTNLQNNGFEISDMQPYGGGAVYALKKDKLTLYLNLVPTKEGAGTIVVIWKRPPG